MDNDTQQNSWYNIIIVALKLKGIISKYQEKYLKEFNKEDILNITDQKALKDIKDFLQPFKRVIKEIKGNKAILNKMLFIIDFMVKYFKSALQKYIINQKLCNYICTSWHAFDKYYLKTTK